MQIINKIRFVLRAAVFNMSCIKKDSRFCFESIINPTTGDFYYLTNNWVNIFRTYCLTNTPAFRVLVIYKVKVNYVFIFNRTYGNF